MPLFFSLNTGVGSLGNTPGSPNVTAFASLGALHSMLGAMDKRVSEEVGPRDAGGQVGVLWRTECSQLPKFERFLPYGSGHLSCLGHESLLHPLPVRSRCLCLLA